MYYAINIALHKNTTESNTKDKVIPCINILTKLWLNIHTKNKKPYCNMQIQVAWPKIQ